MTSRVAAFSAILLVATLAVPRGAAAASPDDTARWSNLQTIPSGAPILVTASDGRILKRTMVLASDTQLVALDLGRLPTGVDASVVLSIVRDAPTAVASTLAWKADQVTVMASAPTQASAPAPQSRIDEATWQRIRLRLPPSLRGTPAVR